MRYLIFRAASAACALGLVLLVKPAPVVASHYTKLTYFTFSGAVQVPGATLPAGTYQFKLADSHYARKVTIIQDARGRTTYAQCFTLRSGYREDNEDAAITLHETREGMPPAVHEWFYPGDDRGYELVYAGKHKEQLASSTGVPHAQVLAVTK